MNSKHYPLILTGIAAGLLVYGTLNTHLELEGLGLIQGLPVAYFVGLGVLVIATVYLWTLKEPQRLLAGVQVLILVTALWLLPVFTGGTYPFTDHTYRNLNISNYLLDQGWRSEGYMQWPGLFVLAAAFSKLINLESIIRYIPYIMQVLCLLPLYVFLKNSLNKTTWSCCFLGLWLFSIARWVGDSQLTPVSLGILLLLVLLALISLVNKYPSKKWLLGLVVVDFGLIVVTHLPTSITALLILGLFSLIKKNRKLIVVSICCFLVVVTWDVAYSGYMIDRLGLNIPVEASTLNNLPVKTTTTESILPVLVGSRDHQIVCGIRIVLSAIFALVGLVGVICSTRKGFIRVLPFTALVVGPLVLLLLSKFYSSSITERVYLYCLPGMAYFGARLLEIEGRRLLPIVLGLLLIITIPMHIVSTYGNQAIDYLSESHIEGIHQASQAFKESHWGVMNTLEGFPLGGKRTIQKIQGNVPDSHIWLTSRDKAWCKRHLGNEGLYDECLETMDNHQRYVLIYSNPDFRLYERTRYPKDKTGELIQ